MRSHKVWRIVKINDSLSRVEIIMRKTSFPNLLRKKMYFASNVKWDGSMRYRLSLSDLPKKIIKK